MLDRTSTTLVTLDSWKNSTRVRGLIFALWIQLFSEKMALKRKRFCLGDKLKIIDDCEKGMTLKEMSIKYGVSKSTICTNNKQKKKVVGTLKLTHNGSFARQSLKEGELKELSI